MNSRSCLVLLSTLCAALVSNAQLPIPQKPPGFAYGKGKASAGVQLETYIDLLCPDSKAAYPGLKKLAEFFKPKDFRLKFVLFPLPYHQHAFAVAEATNTIVDALGQETFIPWLETMYQNQDLLWNKATKDLTPIQVTDKLWQFAKKTFPSLKEEDWKRGMTGYGGTDADSEARVAWKYTCSRGISGTPMYTLNGVPFNEADSDWSFEQWRKVIEPLVNANQEEEEQEMEDKTLQIANTMSLHGMPPLPDRQVFLLKENTLKNAPASVCTTYAGGQTKFRPCEFVPGKAMCCDVNEACVLHTGCVTLE